MRAAERDDEGSDTGYKYSTVVENRASVPTAGRREAASAFPHPDPPGSLKGLGVIGP